MLESRRRRAAVSFGLALVAALILAFAPVGAETSARQPAGPGQGPAIVEVTHPSLFETEGWRVVWLFAVPVAIAGVSMVAAGMRGGRLVLVGAAVLLGAWVVIGLPSIGLFFVPATVMMVAAATVPEPG